MIVDAILSVKNQAANIATLIDGVRVPGLRRVTVIDRGSLDDTAERARAHGAVVLLAGDTGLGASYRIAISDLSVLPHLPDAVLIAPESILRRPSSLELLTRELDAGADLAMAVSKRRATVRRFVLARAIGRVYGRRIVAGHTLAIRWPALIALGMNTDGSSWFTALTVRALRLGLTLAEVPFVDEPEPEAITAADLYQVVRHATLR